MRILMLHNDYLRAGGERYSVRAEADGLASIGIDVRLVEFGNKEIDRSAAGAFLQIVHPRDVYLRIEHLIATHAPDLVHVQNLFPTLGSGAINALHAAAVPWVRTMRNYRRRCIAATCYRNNHDCYQCSDATRALPGIAYSCYRDSKIQSLGAATYAALERRSENKWPPRRYILLSEAMRPILKLEGDTAGVVVKPNPVNCTIETLIPQKEREFDGLFVGRLASEKSPELIVEVAKLLPHRRFAMIGSGPLAQQIRDAVRGVHNLDYLGELTQNAVMSFMSRSRAVLVPSAWQEPFGRTAAEALAVGTPALVSRFGGLPEIVQPVDGALVVGLNDPRAWADSLESLLERGPSKLAVLSDRCRIRWAHSYEPRANARRLENIYRECLS